MKFEVSTAVKIQIKVFWIVMLCSVAAGYQHFEGPCCLHLNPEDGGINNSTLLQYCTAS